MIYTFFQQHRHMVLLLLCIGALLASYLSPMTEYGSGDTTGTLMVSQAILEHGTIQLDAYVKNTTVGIPNVSGIHYNTYRNGHFYYFFPLGTSLVVLPFVWAASLTGHDMFNVAENIALQSLISALIVALVCVLLYWLARYFLAPPHALLTTAAWTFGSSVMSTMGQTLWSVNTTFVFLLLTVILLVRYEHNPTARRFHPPLIAISLFAAYLCRPTTMVPAAVILLFMFWKHRTACLTMSGILTLLVGGYMLFNIHEFHQVLPHYYMPQRVEQTDTFWLAIYGNLLSPARGVIVYSSFLVAIGVGMVWHSKQLIRQPLFIVASAWALLHLVGISRFPHWWAGYSFGSRLFTDALPALILLSLFVWHEMMQLHTPPRMLFIGAFTLLAVISSGINTYQGLYNTYAAFQWNASPPLETHPDYVFDWRYPQFLASPAMLEARWQQHPYSLQQPITFDTTNVTFDHWYEPEPTHGWRCSETISASVHFSLHTMSRSLVTQQEKDVVKWQRDRLILHITASSYIIQQLHVLVNGQSVGMANTNIGMEPTRMAFLVDRSLLHEGTTSDAPDNVIEFATSSVVSPLEINPLDVTTRPVGICLWQMSWEPVSSHMHVADILQTPAHNAVVVFEETGWYYTINVLWGVSPAAITLCLPTAMHITQTFTPTQLYDATITGSNVQEGVANGMFHLFAPPYVDVRQPVTRNRAYVATLSLPAGCTTVQWWFEPRHPRSPNDIYRTSFRVPEVSFTPAP